jgi:CRP/FNR family transcriptional regulator, anaerobic regulatory protein
MLSLSKYLKHSAFFKESDIVEIIELFEPVHLNENEYFIIQGNTNVVIGFIENGVMKAALEADDQDDNVQYFVGSGHFISEPYLLYKQQAAVYAIKAATEADLMVCSIDRLNTFDKKINGLSMLIKSISERELADIIEQKNMINLNNASNKFKCFEKAYPEIAAQVKDYDIASFLGITRYTLCRIKKKQQSI